MRKDRSVLTLDFKKNKKESETSYSSDSKAQIAERQRILKDVQAKRNIQNKKNFVKSNNIVFNKNNIDISNVELMNNDGVNNNINKDINDLDTNNITNTDFVEVKKVDKNYSNNEYNKKNKEDNNKKDDKKPDFKKKNFRDYKDYKNKDKKDYKDKTTTETVNDKNTDSKNKTDKIETNNNLIIKNIAVNNIQNNKTSQNKDGKFKNFKDINFDDENAGEKNKKIFKDRNEKYSKNIHTFVFNDDDGANELKYFSKNKRRNKKNEDKNQQQQKIFQVVNIPDFISVSELSDRMNEKKGEIIKKLLTMGIKATINQIIDADTAELIVIEFGHTPNRVSDSDIENILNENRGTKFIQRSPVVTVMGHVDHGKTSLLDALRTTKVAESESGGITQHIGASRIECDNGKFITFIDTPGHEAFTEMRMRGAKITDIVVLVVAADDGVKDQTIEAINHTKAAKVPMIVAINKIDKENADPDRIKQELLNYDIVAEDFGGDTMFVNVSAKNKLNIDKLLETILLQAEMLDLKAPIDCKAIGAVIESKVDQKQGVVATVLVQEGILKVSDIILAGASYGKVKKMLNDKRKNQEEVGPSMAVEILGFNTTPSAGDIFNVVSTDKEARDIVSYRERKLREAKEAMRSKTSEGLLQQVKGSNKKQLSIVLKCDVSGSIEAIIGSLLKLNDNDEVIVDIIHSAIGSITETDINLASASNAIVVGFNVRGNSNIKDLAKEKGVEIKYYSIIYDIVDDIKAIMSGLLKPLEKEKIIGQAEIRNIIKVSGIGNIAGSYVTDGEIRRNSNIRLIRDGIVIFNGKIKALRRFKDDVKEVKNNYECGISIENYDDIKEKDIIECYEVIEEKRKL